LAIFILDSRTPLVDSAVPTDSLQPIFFSATFLSILCDRPCSSPLRIASIGKARHFRQSASLHYFVPVIDEILRQPLPPGYVRYLEYKLEAFKARRAVGGQSNQMTP
jgi:hypothetical protein